VFSYFLEMMEFDKITAGQDKELRPN